MNFVEHVIEKFQNFAWTDAVLIALLSVVFVCAFITIKRCNAVWLAHILIIYYIFVIVLNLLGVFPVVVAAVFYIMPIVFCIAIFTPEMKQKILRYSWRSQTQHKHENVTLNLVEMEETVAHIVRAVQKMAKQDVGALIVIVPEKISGFILESGTQLNADISAELIEALFVPKTPLHDGAIIIKGKKILAAGCYLPLSQASNLPKELGTRHRAAVGISESDPTVTAIVVSEETGIISAMHDGKYKRYLDPETLANVLKDAYSMGGGQNEGNLWRVEQNEEQSN